MTKLHRVETVCEFIPNGFHGFTDVRTCLVTWIFSIVMTLLCKFPFRTRKKYITSWTPMFHLLLLEKFVQGNQVQSQGLKSDMHMIINIDPSRGVKKY